MMCLIWYSQRIADNDSEELKTRQYTLGGLSKILEDRQSYTYTCLKIGEIMRNQYRKLVKLSERREKTIALLISLFLLKAFPTCIPFWCPTIYVPCTQWTMSIVSPDLHISDACLLSIVLSYPYILHLRRQLTSSFHNTISFNPWSNVLLQKQIGIVKNS